MKNTKRIVALFLALTMCMSNAFTCNIADAASDEIKIVLSNEKITCDGETVTDDNTKDVYYAKEIETHDDVKEEYKDLENTVLYITEAGTYRLSGTATDTQIKVAAEDDDVVNLILDGLNVSCKTATALLITNAYDPKEAGKAGVTLTLAEGSDNYITGSHVAKYFDENNNKIKYDGALESEVSLLINGEGNLTIDADNEGLECKMHLTFESGNVQIKACDDAVNANEDNVSVITINGGVIYAYVSGDGSEGDGIDSNGYVVINDGFVVAQAHPSSQDSGLDSDCGITINGGTVVATGNMNDGIDASSKQGHMLLNFSQKQNDPELIVVVNEDDEVVFAFDPINSYQVLELSDPDLVNGTYHLYLGGTIKGEESFGCYTKVTSYTKGTQLSNTGATSAQMQRPEGMGEMPEGMEEMKKPEDMTEEELKEMQEKMKDGQMQIPFNNGEQMQGNEQMKRPEDMTEEELEEMRSKIGEGNQGPMMPGNNQDANASRTYDFVITDENHAFNGVSTDAESTQEEKQEQGKFKDVKTNDWYYEAVTYANENGICKGTSDNEFSPNTSMTRAMAVTILYNLAKTPEVKSECKFKDIVKDSWYEDALIWANENGIVKGYSDDEFGPNDLVTREQLATMIYNYVTIIDKENVSDKDLESAELDTYKDKESISSWAEKGARYCNLKSIITGNENKEFSPKKTATRAEAVTMIMRYAKSKTTK